MMCTKEERTRNVIHRKITARHELNVHDLPYTRGIRIPNDLAIGALIKDVSGSGRGGVGVGANSRESGDEGGSKKFCEHGKQKFEHLGCVVGIPVIENPESCVSKESGLSYGLN